MASSVTVSACSGGGDSSWQMRRRGDALALALSVWVRAGACVV